MTRSEVGAVSRADPRGPPKLFDPCNEVLARAIGRRMSAVWVAQWVAVVSIAWVSHGPARLGPNGRFVSMLVAAVAGGGLGAAPIWLTNKSPVASSTRLVATLSQAGYGALLLGVTGGRQEAALYAFVSLAILAWYRDARTIVLASWAACLTEIVRREVLVLTTHGGAGPDWLGAAAYSALVTVVGLFLVQGGLDARPARQERPVRSGGESPSSGNRPGEVDLRARPEDSPRPGGDRRSAAPRAASTQATEVAPDAGAAVAPPRRLRAVKERRPPPTPETELTSSVTRAVAAPDGARDSFPPAKRSDGATRPARRGAERAQREERAPYLSSTSRPPQNGKVGGRRDLFSDLADDPEMTDLIAAFVGGLAHLAGSMETACGRGERDLVRQLAHQVRGAAGGYGFPSITAAAAEVEAVARAGGPIEASVQKLCTMCRSVRVAGGRP